jgi:large subunit ribosomal protein L10
MLASLSQAVYLLNAPLAQAARLAGALQAKRAEEGQDPTDLDAGGAGTPAAAEEAPADVVEAPADEVTEAPADEADEDAAPAGSDAPAAEAAAASDESDTTEA